MKKNDSTQQFLFSLMKISLTQFLLAVLFSSITFAHDIKGQDLLDRKISLQAQGESLKAVLVLIEKATDAHFMYSSSLIPTDKKITIEVQKERLSAVLERLLTPHQLTYHVSGQQIIISRKPQSPSTGKISEQAPPSVWAAKKQETEDLLAVVAFPIKGRITDEKGEPLVGASVVLQGTTKGNIADENGNYSLDLSDGDKNGNLVFSFVGFDRQIIPINGRNVIDAILTESGTLKEVVVVGYGTQKKASVVGAIATTSGADLERTGGVTNLAQALTGNLPGLTTIQTSGQPGNNDPLIYIRGQSTWNGGQPYILVDGVERRMNDIDMSEVDNISVLKDASATAVYGVKGANGVILITTKRGTKGKPVLSISTNTTVKSASRLIPKLDAYDMFLVKNRAVEKEVVVNESEWIDFTPLTIVNRYRNPNNVQNLKYPEAFPNVDWQKEMIKPTSLNNRVNLNIAGGSDFVKYFTSLAYLHEGDLFNIRDNGRGYKPGYGFDRFNFRSNLDLSLTKTTSFRINLAGVFGTVKAISSATDPNYILSGQYALPANAFLPQYSDGRWGVSPMPDTRVYNSAAYAAVSGYDKTKKTDLLSDFTLTQRLDFITKGLSASANLSFDNHFESVGGVTDPSNNFSELSALWYKPYYVVLPMYLKRHNYFTVCFLTP